MNAAATRTLTAFRVTYADGSSYVTSMAAGVTLRDAALYFVGQEIEQADGSVKVVASVRELGAASAEAEPGHPFCDAGRLATPASDPAAASGYAGGLAGTFEPWRWDGADSIVYKAAHASGLLDRVTAEQAPPRFYGTIEYLPTGEAIVTLTDSDGEWSGACRIQCRSRRRDDLYEAGFTSASVNASGKGGRLESFREVGP